MKQLFSMQGFIIVTLLILTGCNTDKQNIDKVSSQKGWEEQLATQIKLLGHRNWIVVSDAAYPLQSKPGITTIISDNGHLETIQKVNALIQAQQHIKPIIYLDKEINFVDEKDANGITEFRTSLQQIINAESSQKVLHEDIIGMLDDASKLFNIIIIKTDFSIPYTSVFFQLDCKYWNAEAEKKLREQIMISNN